MATRKKGETQIEVGATVAKSAKTAGKDLAKILSESVKVSISAAVAQGVRDGLKEAKQEIARFRRRARQQEQAGGGNEFALGPIPVPTSITSSEEKVLKSQLGSLRKEAARLRFRRDFPVVRGAEAAVKELRAELKERDRPSKQITGARLRALGASALADTSKQAEIDAAWEQHRGAYVPSQKQGDIDAAYRQRDRQQKAADAKARRALEKQHEKAQQKQAGGPQYAPGELVRDLQTHYADEERQTQRAAARAARKARKYAAAAAVDAQEEKQEDTSGESPAEAARRSRAAHREAAALERQKNRLLNHVPGFGRYGRLGSFARSLGDLVGGGVGAWHARFAPLVGGVLSGSPALGALGGAATGSMVGSQLWLRASMRAAAAARIGTAGASGVLAGAAGGNLGAAGAAMAGAAGGGLGGGVGGGAAAGAAAGLGLGGGLAAIGGGAALAAVGAYGAYNVGAMGRAVGAAGTYLGHAQNLRTFNTLAPTQMTLINATRQRYLTESNVKLYQRYGMSSEEALAHFNQYSQSAGGWTDAAHNQGRLTATAASLSGFGIAPATMGVLDYAARHGRISGDVAAGGAGMSGALTALGAGFSGLDVGRYMQGFGEATSRAASMGTQMSLGGTQGAMLHLARRVGPDQAARLMFGGQNMLSSLATGGIDAAGSPTEGLLHLMAASGRGVPKTHAELLQMQKAATGGVNAQYFSGLAAQVRSTGAAPDVQAAILMRVLGRAGMPISPGQAESLLGGSVPPELMGAAALAQKGPGEAAAFTASGAFMGRAGVIAGAHQETVNEAQRQNTMLAAGRNVLPAVQNLDQQLATAAQQMSGIAATFTGLQASLASFANQVNAVLVR